MADTLYDVAIIGSGPAGYTAAIRAGQLGLSTALIEKDPYLGGTCLHVGCIPTKSLLFNAEVYDHVKDGPALGLENTAAVTVNWPSIQKRKQGIVDKHAKGLQFLMKKNKVTVITGYGKLSGPAKNGILTVEVDGKDGKSTVTAKNVILSTGSVARVLPGLKPDDRILTNIEVLSLDEIPKSLIVIGSGAVGVEFASIYKSFGTADVTILEMLPRYVPVEDEEVSKELMRVYRKRGINGFVNAKVENVERTKDGVAVTFTVDGKQQKLEAEKVLIAVGRAPRTENVGIEKTKIEVDRGFVKTDQFMRTAEPGIYAIGDIAAGYPQLAHSGAMEGIVAVTHIAGKPVKPVNVLRIPNATYCHPEIGSVGLTEAKAKELGYDVKVGKFPFTANSRASIVGQHEGFVKIVTDAQHGEILGVHIIGPTATELIAESVVALELECTAEELANIIHAHPTLSEAMLDAANAVFGMPINT
ncbi:MAG TPA: dihydrolipoyl dehydrogenase [Candidatus Eisenbacteria bacterium]|nr:dihydrolipoyl dehydrogenase [Candidatus Eisenbacteria bacterium]